MPTDRPVRARRANPHIHPAWVYEPVLSEAEGPLVPIMEELAARPDPELDTRSDNAKRNWGGARPGAGAPKGNLNALKHGRTSKRQRDLLEALLELPETRQAFIDIANRNRRRRKQAEEGAGLMLLGLLDRVAQTLVNQEDNQAHINQDLVEVINATTAQIKVLLKKQSRKRTLSIKQPPATNN